MKNIFLLTKDNIEFSTENFESYWGSFDELITNIGLPNSENICEIFETIIGDVFEINYPIRLPLLEILDLLSSHTDQYNCNNIKLISVINPSKIFEICKFLFLYLLFKFCNELLPKIEHNEEFTDFATQIILKIYHYINSSEGTERITDNLIQEEIKIYKAQLNRRRKHNFEKLPEELKSLQKLYRKFGLGNQFSGWDEDQNNLENINDEQHYQQGNSGNITGSDSQVEIDPFSIGVEDSQTIGDRGVLNDDPEFEGEDA
jgi:hypothetical protein